METLQQASFVDSFFEAYEFNQVTPLDVSFSDIYAEDGVWDHWGTETLERLLTFNFLDDVDPSHPIIEAMARAWDSQFIGITDGDALLYKVHQSLLDYVKGSDLHARTLVHLELSLMMHLAKKHGCAIPDVHAYDAVNVFDQVSYGICWPTQDGWRAFPLLSPKEVFFDLDGFSCIELTGRDPTILYPNGCRKLQPLHVVDSNHSLVSDIVRHVFPTFDGLGVMGIVDGIRAHMQGYQYISDVRHEWQSLDTIFLKGGGDCEDLAHLEASLLIRALADAGFHDVKDSISFKAGLVGQGMSQFGHTIIELSIDGEAFVIDSTSRDGLVKKHVYDALYGFHELVAYSMTSSVETVSAAMALDTKSQPRTDFLNANGMLTYYKAAREYYAKITNQPHLLTGINDTLMLNGNTPVTDFSDPDIVDAFNTQLNQKQTNIREFWGKGDAEGSKGSDLASAQNVDTTVSNEAIDFGKPVYVGENVKYLDTKTGLNGMMERVYHRFDEMTLNLTSKTMNQYVGQTYGGYHVYDYSRIMDDYNNLLDTIQSLTCYLTAVTVYANAFNWIGSQLSGDNEPHSEVKARQRLVKSVQGALLKMVDQIDYFIPLFVEAYDSSNQALFSQYQQEISMEFQHFSVALRDQFTLGEETIRRHQMMEKAHMEYWYVCMKNREKMLQANVTLPQSRVLSKFLNFSDPYGDIMAGEPGGSASFAVFHRQMADDILNERRKAVSINGETKYMDSLHYYLPWYFQGNDELKLYSNAEDVNPSGSKTFTHSFISSYLSEPYASMGLPVATVQLGSFSEAQWVTDVITDQSTSITVDNFKTSQLYKYLYSKGAAFQEQFETEVSPKGFGSVYSGYAQKESWQLDVPSAMIQSMGEKKRLHPLDFSDIVEFESDGRPINSGCSSINVWNHLKAHFFIDAAGNFNPLLVEELLNGGDFNLSALNLNDELSQQVNQRIKGIFSLDAYQHRAMSFNNSSPQLFARAHPNLTDNGYQDMFSNTDEQAYFKNDHYLSGLATGKFLLDGDAVPYNFLADQFEYGKSLAETQSSELINQTVKDQANDGAASKPEFADFNISDWSQIGEDESVRRGLASGDAFDQLFFSDDGLTITVAHQDNYFNQYNKFVVSGDTPPMDLVEGTLEGSGEDATFIPYSFYHFQSKPNWEIKHFLKIEPDQLEAYQAIRSGGTSSEQTQTEAALPLFSKQTTYDFGVSSQLPFDNRIVSAATTANGSAYFNRFTGFIDESNGRPRIKVRPESLGDDFYIYGQAPEVIGKVNYFYSENSALDLDHELYANLVQSYDAPYYFDDFGTLNKYRQMNSLEKKLTPVHSFNDESLVISTQSMARFMGFNGYTTYDVNSNSDWTLFKNFTTTMEDQGMIKPVFKRVQDGNNAGKYELMGYTFLAPFFDGDNGKISLARLNGDPLEYDANSFEGFTVEGIDDPVTKARALRAGVEAIFMDQWRQRTRNDMLRYVYHGSDHRSYGFLNGYVTKASVNAIKDGIYDELKNNNIIKELGVYDGETRAQVVDLSIKLSELEEKWPTLLSTDQRYKILNELKNEAPSRGQQNQLLRWVGQPVKDPIHGLDEATPMLADDWHQIKAAHNGMISIQNRIRLFYFVMQTYVAAVQNITKKIDGVANTGTGYIESDLQMVEKRMGKQTQLFQQISAANQQLIQVNNDYYKQKMTTIKESDLSLRVQKGIELYAGLLGGVTFLAAEAAKYYVNSTLLPLITANCVTPPNPGCGPASAAYGIGVAIYTGLNLAAGGLNLTSMIGGLTQKAIKLAQEYGMPQMVETNLIDYLVDESEASDVLNKKYFQNLVDYKTPVNFDNGGAWIDSLNNFSATSSGDKLKIDEIFKRFSTVDMDYPLDKEALFRDPYPSIFDATGGEWRISSQTIGTKEFPGSDGDYHFFILENSAGDQRLCRMDSAGNLELASMTSLLRQLIVFNLEKNPPLTMNEIWEGKRALRSSDVDTYVSDLDAKPLIYFSNSDDAIDGWRLTREVIGGTTFPTNEFLILNKGADYRLVKYSGGIFEYIDIGQSPKDYMLEQESMLGQESLASFLEGGGNLANQNLSWDESPLFIDSMGPNKFLGEFTYTHHTGYAYQHEEFGRDDWQDGQTTMNEKNGDCEDYAMLAASAATKAGIETNKLRVVSGRLGYGGPAPVSHTVLLYDPSGQFETITNSVTGKAQFYDIHQEKLTGTAHQLSQKFESFQQYTVGDVLYPAIPDGYIYEVVSAGHGGNSLNNNANVDDQFNSDGVVSRQSFERLGPEYGAIFDQLVLVGYLEEIDGFYRKKVDSPALGSVNLHDVVNRTTFVGVGPGYGDIFDALIREDIIKWDETTYAYAEGHSDASLGSVFVNGRLLSQDQVSAVQALFSPRTLTGTERSNVENTFDAATFKKIKDDRIKVIDLTRPRHIDGNSTPVTYSLAEYQNAFGYFQPMYSYDAPDTAVSDVNLSYGFEPWEIFGYEPTASPFQPIKSNGPNNLGPYSDPNGDWYFIDQETNRHSYLYSFQGPTAPTPDQLNFLKDKSNGNVDDRFEKFKKEDSTGTVFMTKLPSKIPYGQKNYVFTSPITGSTVSLGLVAYGDVKANYDVEDVPQPMPIEDVEGKIKDDISSNSGPSMSESDIDFSEADELAVVEDVSTMFRSQGVVLDRVGLTSAASGIVTNNMQRLLVLEMEEHALIQEMHKLAKNPLDFHSIGTMDVEQAAQQGAAASSASFYGYDWPAVQYLVRRLFLAQMKMKKVFLVMKMRAEFFSIIGARLGETERQQISSAMDSIFNSHFTKMNDTVGQLRTLMMGMQRNHAMNYDVQFGRYKSTWNFAWDTTALATTSYINFIDYGVPIMQALEPVMDVLGRTMEFFGNKSNPYYLKSLEDGVRTNTRVPNRFNQVTGGEVEKIGWLTKMFSRDGVDYEGPLHDEYEGTIHNPHNQVPYSLDYTAPTNDFDRYKPIIDDNYWLTMNALKQDSAQEYYLTIDDVVQSYWRRKSTQSVTRKNVYEGTVETVSTSGDLGGNAVPTEWSDLDGVSLEDYVMKFMSNRYFPESGDNLIFLDGIMYAMAGTKLFSDDEYFDWLQGRLSAEMMTQVYYSMYTASLRSVASNLGLSVTGGNDAIQHSTSLTSDIGEHYFELQNILSIWEQLQLDLNKRRFDQLKELDKLILDGIVAVIIAGLSFIPIAANMTSTAANSAKMAILHSIIMFSTEILKDIGGLIYSALDASEENKVLEKSVVVKKKEHQRGPDPDEPDADDSESELMEKKLKKERKSLGEESLQSAGNKTFGFSSTYADQTKKVKMKRQVKGLFKMMEVTQKITESRAEFMKQLASNLGYSTSQVSVGGALSGIQGLAKQAADKSIDSKFEMLEASAARENEIASALQQTISAAVSLGAKVAMKGAMKNVKQKGMRSDNHNKGFSKEAIGSMNAIGNQMINSVVMMAITASSAGALEHDRNERRAENEAGKTAMHESIADPDSSDEGERLDGLEHRALSASLTSASTQEMSKINQMLSDTINRFSESVKALLKTIMDSIGVHLKKMGKEKFKDFKKSEGFAANEGAGDAGKLSAAFGVKSGSMADMAHELIMSHDANNSSDTLTSVAKDIYYGRKKMSQSSLSDQDVLAMAIFADSQDTGGGDQNQRDSRQAFIQKILSKDPESLNIAVGMITNQMSDAQKAKFMQNLIKASEHGSVVAQRLIAGSPDLGRQNIQNVLKAFGNDTAKVLKFIQNKVVPERGGAKAARLMLDAFDDDSTVKGDSDSGRKIQEMLTDPMHAGKVGEIRKAGLDMTLDKDFDKTTGKTTGLVKQLRSIGKDMENNSGKKTKGLIQLFLGSGGKDGLNKQELQALVGALGNVAKEKLQEKLSEEHTKLSESPEKQQQLQQLASMLGVTITQKVLDTKSDDKKNESNNAPTAPVAAAPSAPTAPVADAPLADAPSAPAAPVAAAPSAPAAPVTSIEKANQAATTIQAAFRGYQARKQVAAKENKAATTIQAAFRGYQARKQVAGMKAAAKQTPAPSAPEAPAAPAGPDTEGIEARLARLKARGQKKPRPMSGSSSGRDAVAPVPSARPSSSSSKGSRSSGSGRSGVQATIKTAIAQTIKEKGNVGAVIEKLENSGLMLDDSLTNDLKMNFKDPISRGNSEDSLQRRLVEAFTKDKLGYSPANTPASSRPSSPKAKASPAAKATSPAANATPPAAKATPPAAEPQSKREKLIKQSEANAAAGRQGTISDETKGANMKHADKSVMTLNKHKISTGFIHLNSANIGEDFKKMNSILEEQGVSQEKINDLNKKKGDEKLKMAKELFLDAHIEKLDLSQYGTAISDKDTIKKDLKRYGTDLIQKKGSQDISGIKITRGAVSKARQKREAERKNIEDTIAANSRPPSPAAGGGAGGEGPADGVSEAAAAGSGQGGGSPGDSGTIGSQGGAGGAGGAGTGVAPGGGSSGDGSSNRSASTSGMGTVSEGAGGGSEAAQSSATGGRIAQTSTTGAAAGTGVGVREAAAAGSGQGGGGASGGQGAAADDSQTMTAAAAAAGAGVPGAASTVSPSDPAYASPPGTPAVAAFGGSSDAATSGDGGASVSQQAVEAVESVAATPEAVAGDAAAAASPNSVALGPGTAAATQASDSSGSAEPPQPAAAALSPPHLPPPEQGPGREPGPAAVGSEASGSAASTAPPPTGVEQPPATEATPEAAPEHQKKPTSDRPPIDMPDIVQRIDTPVTSQDLNSLGIDLGNNAQVISMSIDGKAPETVYRITPDKVRDIVESLDKQGTSDTTDGSTKSNVDSFKQSLREAAQRGISVVFNPPEEQTTTVSSGSDALQKPVDAPSGAAANAPDPNPDRGPQTQKVGAEAVHDPDKAAEASATPVSEQSQDTTANIKPKEPTRTERGQVDAPSAPVASLSPDATSTADGGGEIASSDSSVSEPGIRKQRMDELTKEMDKLTEKMKTAISEFQQQSPNASFSTDQKSALLKDMLEFLSHSRDQVQDDYSKALGDGETRETREKKLNVLDNARQLIAVAQSKSTFGEDLFVTMALDSILNNTDICNELGISDVDVDSFSLKKSIHSEIKDLADRSAERATGYKHLLQNSTITSQGKEKRDHLLSGLGDMLATGLVPEETINELKKSLDFKNLVNKYGVNTTMTQRLFGSSNTKVTNREALDFYFNDKPMDDSMLNKLAATGFVNDAHFEALVNKAQGSGINTEIATTIHAIRTAGTDGDSDYVQQVKELTQDHLAQLFDLLPKRDLRFLLRHPAVYEHVHKQLNEVDTEYPLFQAVDRRRQSDSTVNALLLPRLAKQSTTQVSDTGVSSSVTGAPSAPVLESGGSPNVSGAPSAPELDSTMDSSALSAPVLSDLRQALARQQDGVTAAKAMVNKQQTAFDAATKGLENATRAVDDKEKFVKYLKTQLEAAQTELNEVTQKSQVDADAARAELDQQKSDLKNSIDSESQALTTLQKKTDALDKKITESEQAIVKTKSELSQMQDASDLYKAVQDLKSSAEQLVIKQQIADKENPLRSASSPASPKQSSPRSSGVTRLPHESRLTQQKLPTLVTNVFRDLKNQFDAVSDTQMTSDIDKLVTTLHSQKLPSTLTIPSWVSNEDQGTLNENFEQIKTLNKEIKDLKGQLKSNKFSNTERQNIDKQIKDNEAKERRLINQSQQCLTSAKQRVLKETAPKQFVETHFDSIFKHVEEGLGGKSNLQDDRNELKQLCANYIQNLKDIQKNPNTKDKKVEITKDMTTILERINSKYKSSKPKVNSRVGSGKSSSGSPPKTSKNTGVGKQTEAAKAKQREIDQLKETLKQMEAENEQINDEIKTKTSENQKAEEKRNFLTSQLTEQLAEQTLRQEEKATLTTSMDDVKHRIDNFKNQLNTLGIIEADTAPLDNLTAIRDGLEIRLATAKDDLENAKLNFAEQRDKVTASEDNLKTATMKLDTATQEVDNLQAQIAEASPLQPRIPAFGSPQQLGVDRVAPETVTESLDGGDGPVETAMSAAAGAPGGGDGPVEGAPGGVEGSAETAMLAAAGAPGDGPDAAGTVVGAPDGGDQPVVAQSVEGAPDAAETATDPSLTGIAPQDDALIPPNSNALDNFFKMFDGNSESLRRQALDNHRTIMKGMSAEDIQNLFQQVQGDLLLQTQPPTDASPQPNIQPKYLNALAAVAHAQPDMFSDLITSLIDGADAENKTTIINALRDAFGFEFKGEEKSKLTRLKWGMNFHRHDNQPRALAPYIKRLSADAFDTIMASDYKSQSQISGTQLSTEEKQAMVKGELDTLKKQYSHVLESIKFNDRWETFNAGLTQIQMGYQYVMESLKQRVSMSSDDRYSSQHSAKRQRLSDELSSVQRQIDRLSHLINRSDQAPIESLHPEGTLATTIRELKSVGSPPASTDTGLQTDADTAWTIFSNQYIFRSTDAPDQSQVITQIAAMKPHTLADQFEHSGLAGALLKSPESLATLLSELESPQVPDPEHYKEGALKNIKTALVASMFRANPSQFLDQFSMFPDSIRTHIHDIPVSDPSSIEGLTDGLTDVDRLRFAGVCFSQHADDIQALRSSHQLEDRLSEIITANMLKRCSQEDPNPLADNGLVDTAMGFIDQVFADLPKPNEIDGSISNFVETYKKAPSWGQYFYRKRVNETLKLTLKSTVKLGAMIGRAQTDGCILSDDLEALEKLSHNQFEQGFKDRIRGSVGSSVNTPRAFVTNNYSKWREFQAINTAFTPAVAKHLGHAPKSTLVKFSEYLGQHGSVFDKKDKGIAEALKIKVDLVGYRMMAVDDSAMPSDESPVAESDAASGAPSSPEADAPLAPVATPPESNPLPSQPSDSAVPSAQGDPTTPQPSPPLSVEHQDEYFRTQLKEYVGELGGAQMSDNQDDGALIQKVESKIGKDYPKPKFYGWELDLSKSSDMTKFLTELKSTALDDYAEKLQYATKDKANTIRNGLYSTDTGFNSDNLKELERFNQYASVENKVPMFDDFFESLNEDSKGALEHFSELPLKIKRQVMDELRASDRPNKKELLQELGPEMGAAEIIDRIKAPFATSVQTSQREMSQMVHDELAKIDTVEGKEKALAKIVAAMKDSLSFTSDVPIRYGENILNQLKGLDQAIDEETSLDEGFRNGLRSTLADQVVGSMQAYVSEKLLTPQIDHQKAYSLPFGNASMDQLLTFLNACDGSNRDDFCKFLCKNDPQTFDRLLSQLGGHRNKPELRQKMHEIKRDHDRQFIGLDTLRIGRSARILADTPTLASLKQEVVKLFESKKTTDDSDNQSMSDDAKRYCKDVFKQLLITNQLQFFELLREADDITSGQKKKDWPSDFASIMDDAMADIVKDPGLLNCLEASPLDTRATHHFSTSSLGTPVAYASFSMSILGSLLYPVKFLAHDMVVGGLKNLGKGMAYSVLKNPTESIQKMERQWSDMKGRALDSAREGGLKSVESYHKRIVGEAVEQFRFRSAGSRNRLVRRYVKHMADHGERHVKSSISELFKNSRGYDTCKWASAVGLDSLSRMVQNKELSAEAFTAILQAGVDRRHYHIPVSTYVTLGDSDVTTAQVIAVSLADKVADVVAGDHLDIPDPKDDGSDTAADKVGDDAIDLFAASLDVMSEHHDESYFDMQSMFLYQGDTPQYRYLFYKGDSNAVLSRLNGFESRVFNQLKNDPEKMVDFMQKVGKSPGGAKRLKRFFGFRTMDEAKESVATYQEVLNEIEQTPPPKGVSEAAHESNKLDQMAALFVCQGKDGDVILNLDLIKAEFDSLDVEKLKRLFKVLDKVGVREDEMAAIYQQIGYNQTIIFNTIKEGLKEGLDPQLPSHGPSLKDNEFLKQFLLYCSETSNDQIVKDELEMMKELYKPIDPVTQSSSIDQDNETFAQVLSQSFDRDAAKQAIASLRDQISQSVKGAKHSDYKKPFTHLLKAMHYKHRREDYTARPGNQYAPLSIMS